jgi:NADH-quinone oxidoreductase subunit B/C/D
MTPQTGDALESEVRKRITLTSWNKLVGELENFASWGRRSSIWPLGSGLACCAIEMICTAASRFDIARFGAEMFRPSPRQADLMIISGTVTKKMAPILVRLYNQMPEPKYVISMGACANGGGPFKEGYTVLSGIDEFLPVDVYVRGCPPTPNALLNGLMELQKIIDSEPFLKAWRFKKRPEIPVPVLGPDLVDLRQEEEIRGILSAGEPQRLKAGKALPEAVFPLKGAGMPAAAGSGQARQVAMKLGAKFGAGKVSLLQGENILVDRSVWLEAAGVLKNEFGFDYLANLSAADYADCVEVSAHLCGVETGMSRLTARIRAPRTDSVFPSVTGVWSGADFQEREAFDLLGARFDGHPRLARILTWDGFAGHPLRKDWLEPYYEEPVKSYSSRWKDGRHVPAEQNNRWGRNAVYPASGIPEGLASGDDEEWDEPGLLVSMGPQHPSTHGVFQLKVLLDGERVTRLEPVLGYLHRNHEKIGERNTWLMNMPFTDRLDYFCSMSNNLAYAVSVERMAGLKVAERAEYIRIIMAEFTRIVNHMAAIGFLLNDIGAWFTPLLYALEERELVLDLFEAASGSRMMCNYMRFSGVARDLPPGWLEEARRMVADRLPKAIDQVDSYLTRNEIIKARLEGVGILPRERAVNLGASGPVLRASGVKYDIRRAEPYSIYDRFEFEIPVGKNGDSYDRYLVRVAEMRQSLRILSQALKQIPEGGPVIEKNQHLIRVPEGEAYSRFENPKGELGFHLVSTGGMNPYRYHVRTPSFVNLTGLDEMVRGHFVADVVAILGSIDIVLGEVDR